MGPVPRLPREGTHSLEVTLVLPRQTVWLYKLVKHRANSSYAETEARKRLVFARAPSLMPTIPGGPMLRGWLVGQRLRVFTSISHRRLGGPRTWSWLCSLLTSHEAKQPVVETLVSPLISLKLHLHTDITQRPQVFREMT